MHFESLPLSLRQLQYVLAIDETQSFSRAAERCHVSQPSLSSQVAQLEDSLGVRLFERDRRRVLRTAAGEVVIAHARRVLLDCSDLLTAADACQDPWGGRWRLGVIPTISPYLLPVVAPAIREAYPRLDIVWTEDKTEVLVKNLQEGHLEAAILALEAQLGDLQHHVLAKDEFVLAMAHSHRLAGSRRRIAVEELAQEEILLLDDGHCLSEQALSFCARTSAKELGYRATSLATLTEMVAAGSGVTLLPTLALALEARADRLATRQFKKPAPARTIALVWRKNSALQPALQQAAETLVRVMG